MYDIGKIYKKKAVPRDRLSFIGCHAPHTEKRWSGQFNFLSKVLGVTVSIVQQMPDGVYRTLAVGLWR